jgi:allophanate hydrolase
LGAEIVEIDYEPFSQAASLLYAGPWVAERAAAVGDFVAAGHPGLDPTVASIIGGAAKWSARDAFVSGYKLEALRRVVERVWQDIDALLLPTAPTHYRVAEVLADPIALNSRLGTYTNFVNLLDLCAIAVPACNLEGSVRPFGVTFMAPAWQDQPLAAIARQFVEQNPISPPLPRESISLCVAGAHLAGMPLHHQLVSRGARFLSRCLTAPGYRLYALKNTVPPKPGLVREPGFAGAGIEVEVYALSPADFGTFVAEIPAPLGIGNVELADGTTLKGFICEPAALDSALEITDFGGWRAWMASKKPS